MAKGKYVSFRVTDEEKIIIIIKAAKAKMTISDLGYISIMKSKINVIDTSTLKELTKELNKLGNNFNQGIVLAHQGKVEIINIDKLIDTQSKIWELLTELTETNKR